MYVESAYENTPVVDVCMVRSGRAARVNELFGGGGILHEQWHSRPAKTLILLLH